MADDARDEEEIDRDAVLARRRKMVAVALAGLTSLTGAACGPTACLSIAAPPMDAGPDAGRDAGPDGGDGGGPDPDAGDRPPDAGGPVDSGARDAAAQDATMVVPTPCLSMVPPDSGAAES